MRWRLGRYSPCFSVGWKRFLGREGGTEEGQWGGRGRGRPSNWKLRGSSHWAEGPGSYSSLVRSWQQTRTGRHSSQVCTDHTRARPSVLSLGPGGPPSPRSCPLWADASGVQRWPGPSSLPLCRTRSLTSGGAWQLWSHGPVTSVTQARGVGGTGVSSQACPVLTLQKPREIPHLAQHGTPLSSCSSAGHSPYSKACIGVPSS